MAKRGKQMTQAKAAYSRILVKLSGEALMGEGDYGIDPQVLRRIAGELQDIVEMQVQLAVVIGGGNIFRGAGLARAGMDRVAADHMGMLATVMNALAMQDALESLGMHARVMSAIRIPASAVSTPTFSRTEAMLLPGCALRSNTMPPAMAARPTQLHANGRTIQRCRRRNSFQVGGRSVTEPLRPAMVRSPPGRPHVPPSISIAAGT